MSRPIIAAGKRTKRAYREVARSLKYKQAPFFKEIHVLGLSFWLMLKPRQNGCIDEVITTTGTWETELGASLKKHVRTGDICVDIGANIGYHSMFVAAHLAHTGKVYAFEPIKALCDQIAASVTKNNFSNVILSNTALGEQPGTVPMSIRKENMGESSIGSYNDLRLAPISSTEMITVDTLDSALRAEAAVNVIKIDTEGYEFEALKGGKDTLERHHPLIFMEFSPMFYENDYKGKSEAFASYLIALGYSFYTLDEQPLDLMTWTKQHAGIDEMAQIDILCRIPRNSQ